MNSLSVINLPRYEAGGKTYFKQADFPAALDAPIVRLKLGEHIFNVFQQNSRVFDDYSDYMNSHGCACCSLTTVLGAYADSEKSEDVLMPQTTIAEIERGTFGKKWDANYSKPHKQQMPVSFAGIVQILDSRGIDCSWQPKVNRNEIVAHLEGGNPVMVETSRIRYAGPIPVSINDRKYAGSYHTMVILGIEEDGDTVWVTDSATRSWAGSMQRLKRVSLRDMCRYMFNCRSQEGGPYYDGRSRSGGVIYIY